jgi:hypothetical protein
MLLFVNSAARGVDFMIMSEGLINVEAPVAAVGLIKITALDRFRGKNVSHSS